MRNVWECLQDAPRSRFEQLPDGTLCGFDDSITTMSNTWGIDKVELPRWKLDLLRQKYEGPKIEILPVKKIRRRRPASQCASSSGG